MKKFSPGCLCCGKDCTDACYFPCTGGEEATDCLVCGIDIQLPTPDTTGLDPLTIPNTGCPDEAPCFTCYRWFDRIFPFFFYGFGDDVISPNPGDTCNDWEFQWRIPYVGYQIFYPEDGVNKIIEIDPCWNSRDYNCPYDNELDLYQCDSSNVALSGSWVTKGLPPLVTLTGNEWNGTCGKLTLTIRYAAVEFQVGQTTIPIGEPEECVDPKWTEFIHTFELNYCTCSELFNAFTYVSTSTTDSCAGAVDDPCNFASATITLKTRPERTAYCNVCSCMNCVGQRTDQLLLTVSGPVINGTFLMQGFFVSTGMSSCSYRYETALEACPQLRDFQVFIQCLACDLFTATLSIQSTANYTMWAGKTNAFNCDETPTFNQVSLNNGDPPCQLDGHTFQLSFVPG